MPDESLELRLVLRTKKWSHAKKKVHKEIVLKQQGPMFGSVAEALINMAVTAGKMFDDIELEYGDFDGT